MNDTYPSTATNPASGATEKEKPLVYEETPVIEPVKEEVPPPAPTPPPVSPLPAQAGKPPRRGILGILGNLVLFAALFAVGVWLSMYAKQFLPTGLPAKLPPVGIIPTTKVTATPTQAVTRPTDPYAGWKTYQVISGATRQAIAEVNFKLPPEVLPPICDGTTYASQGTYLSGGTRFTVAARGVGQLLPDPRGALLTDVSGRAFTMREATVAGLAATEFRGEFVGVTAGGYAFTKMRGVMLGITDKLVIEMNHFAPSGVTSDFAADDILFDKILASIELSIPGQKGEVKPASP
ncbi:MAG: hypothetical protein ACOY0S_04735 [Patescibacteria group bacterium]